MIITVTHNKFSVWQRLQQHWLSADSSVVTYRRRMCSLVLIRDGRKRNIRHAAFHYRIIRLLTKIHTNTDTD